MTLGQSRHVHGAGTPRASVGRFHSDAASFVQPEAATTAELVPSLADSVAEAKRALGGFDDARMGAMWRLQSGEWISTMPRA